MKSGVIYDANDRNLHGSVYFSTSVLSSLVHLTFRLTGAGVASFALASLIFIYGPVGYYQFQSMTTPTGAYAQEENPAEVKTQKNRFLILNTQTPKPKDKVQEVASQEFSISISAINASAPVILNVDPFNEKIYKSALKEGIAHAQGTALPGEGKTIYMFAHSTDSPFNFFRYNAVFYRLRELKEGQQITLNYKGTPFVYAVESQHIVGAKDVKWLTVKNEEELILQTCYPPGTTLKRLIVVARRVTG